MARGTRDLSRESTRTPTDDCGGTLIGDAFIAQK